MNHLKVSTRLAWSFGILIALLFAVAGVAVSRLGSVNDAMKVVIDSRAPRLQALNDIALAAMDNARIARNIILLTDEAGMAKNEAAYEKNTATVNDKIAYLKKTQSDGKEADLMRDLESARAAYVAYTKEVIALGLANKNDEATKLLYGENYKTQAAYFAAIKASVDAEHDAQVAAGVDASNTYATARIVVIGLGAVACLVGIGMAIVISRGLMRQLGGEPTYATGVARRIAQGDLSLAIVTPHNDRDSLVAEMKAMQDSLTTVVSSVRQYSESVATASDQIAQGNQDLSQRTEQQASSLEETASSMEQLGATVKQNAENARHANQLAQTASGVAAKGGVVVGQVVDTMKEINDSSRKIADIIGVIDGIAFQTNILALNAAVEAARAGEQGRGFAVVASEVRSLAGRSAEAAKEIKSLIGASVDRVEQGTALANQAGVTMSEVVRSVKLVTDIMGQISAASSEQSAGVAQVGQAVSQMDQVTQQNSALVEESAAAAESLRQQAQHLVEAVAVFKLTGSSTGKTLPAPARGQESAIAVAPTLRSHPVKRAAPPASSIERKESAPAVADVAVEWEAF